MSLDMVGEDTEKTGGTFLVEKMPDPSAIWTRGTDKHSEWGGDPMRIDEMKPHYLNDFILTTFEQQGKYADWTVKTNPFEGGSDHTPFIQEDIPGLLLWHFTDQFYHTDQDRLDKVSQQTIIRCFDSGRLKGFNIGTWFGVLAPAATPKDIVARLNAEMVKIIQSPEFKAKMADIGAEPIGNTSAQMAQQIASETEKFGKLVKEAKVVID